jgi:hypothetical protein
VFLDSPSTTSATTYKTQVKVSGSGHTMYLTWDSVESTITLMEIGA